MAVAAGLSLSTGQAYPLRAPLTAFDPDSSCPEVPICTLMATEHGWDWIAAHWPAVDAAARSFAAAVLSSDADEAHWVSAHFGRFTLATRGARIHGVVSVALIELD